MSPHTGATDTAWYVYAVLRAGAAPPRCEQAILPGATLEVVGAGPAGLACLASRVPRAPFTGGDAGAPVDDPQWVAARAAAHHAVVAACQGCLPLGFGTIFSGLPALQAWLGANNSCLRHALAAVGGRQEWLLQLIEDAEAHAAWLSAHDPALLALSAQAATATQGRAFLLARRLAGSVQAAREGRAAAIAAAIAARLDSLPCRHIAEPARAGAAWSLLAAPGYDPAPALHPIIGDLEGTGLTLRLAGPFPPYGHARAAWNEVARAA